MIENYYKLKCEKWFNDRNIIVYGLFATDREYIPITIKNIYAISSHRITNINTWKELYKRKEEVINLNRK